MTQKETTPDSSEFDEPNVFEAVNQLSRVLQSLDDRGLVLSLAAFAEDALKELIESFLIPCHASSELTNGFNAPLGSLSAKLKAAVGLGLITEVQHDDLDRLRRVRNYFAHTWRQAALTDHKIRDIAGAVTPSRLDMKYHESLSERFRSSIVCVLVEIKSSTHQNRVKSVKAKLTGGHLYPGFGGADPAARVERAAVELALLERGLSISDGDKFRFFAFQARMFFSRLVTLNAEVPDALQATYSQLFIDHQQLCVRFSLEMIEQQFMEAWIERALAILAKQKARDS